MSLNYKKVEQTAREQIEKERNYSPAEIFEGVEVKTSGGSFGACLLTIEGKYSSVSAKYISNYLNLSNVVSDFISHSYFNFVGRFYEANKGEGEKYTLEITNSKAGRVNLITCVNPLKVYSELVYCYRELNPKTRKSLNIKRIRRNLANPCDSKHKKIIFIIEFCPIADNLGANTYKYTFENISEAIY